MAYFSVWKERKWKKESREEKKYGSMTANKIWMKEGEEKVRLELVSGA